MTGKRRPTREIVSDLHAQALHCANAIETEEGVVVPGTGEIVQHNEFRARVEALAATKAEGVAKVEAIAAVLDAVREARDVHEADRVERVKRVQRAAAKRDAAEREIDWLRALLRSLLDALGTEKVKTDLHTVYLKAGQPGVAVTCLGDVPEEWLAPREIRARDVKQALLDGKDVPGVVLTPATKHVEVR